MPNAFESEGNKEEALQKPQVRAVTHFPLELLNDLRSQAGQAATVRGEGPDGWTKSETDPMDVLAVFKTLRIKPGYVLRGYQFRAHYDGNGVVYALPEGEFPDPADCPADERYALAPPVPIQALKSWMDAIEGDGSSLSYLSASILLREMAEFGAIWHGCSWSSHQFLDANPVAAHAADQWQWQHQGRIDWRPRATQNKNSVTVSFCTFTGLICEQILRHSDVFSIGSYRPTCKVVSLAIGPRGYVH